MPQELKTVDDTVLQNDPFMTHNTRYQKQPGRGSAAKQDQSSVGMPLQNLVEDPFMTGSSVRMPQQAQELQPGNERGPGYGKKQRTCLGKPPGMPWSVFFLGPSVEDKDATAGYVLVLVPWLVFVFVFLLWTVWNHWSETFPAVFTAAAFSVSFGLCWTWYFAVSRRSSKISLISLGFLCLLASLFGLWVGLYGWNNIMRQYWWNRTGVHFTAASASTPAASFADAASVHFTSEAKVDISMGAGYRDGDIYCAAPVLSPNMAASGLILVEYWAIGINCCESVGSFSCDDSRKPSASTGAGNTTGGAYGVRMLHGGFPCPECFNKEIQAAITKAEAIFGLVSSAGNLQIRWMKNKDEVWRGQSLRVFALIFSSFLISLVFFYMLGSAFNHLGIGRSGTKKAVDLQYDAMKTARTSGSRPSGRQMDNMTDTSLQKDPFMTSGRQLDNMTDTSFQKDPFMTSIRDGQPPHQGPALRQGPAVWQEPPPPARQGGGY